VSETVPYRELDPWPGRHLVVPVLAIVAAAVMVARGGAPVLEPLVPESEASEQIPAMPGRMPDFAAISDSATRKEKFFEYLLPAVEHVNAEIRKRRHKLMQIARRFRGGSLHADDKQWLDRMAGYYDVDADDTTRRLDVLERRIDVIPPSLALAQAAIESAWGTSRFARMGKNLFGEWCFRAGCGIVPAQRPSNREYEVRTFPSVQDSIRSYIHNLNTHDAYREMRTMRQQARRAGRDLSAAHLAKALDRYSERGEAYVDDVRTIIRANDLPSLVGSG